MPDIPKRLLGHRSVDVIDVRQIWVDIEAEDNQIDLYKAFCESCLDFFDGEYAALGRWEVLEALSPDDKNLNVRYLGTMLEDLFLFLHEDQNTDISEVVFTFKK